MRVASVVLLLLIVGCRFDRSGLTPGDVSWVRDAATGERPPSPDAEDRDAPASDQLADAAPDEGVPDSAIFDSAIADTGLDPLAPFGAAQPATALNTGLNENDPTLTGDMLEIYFDRDNDIFASDRPGGLGAHDIYVSTRAQRSGPALTHSTGSSRTRWL